MPRRQLRKPNALKHGGFSRADLLPWEDPDEFEQLRRGLVEELQPDGPLEQDCVDTITSLQWRKRRVLAKRNFDIAAELARAENHELWEDPPPLFDTRQELLVERLKGRVSPPRASRARDDYQQLLGFSSHLFGNIDGRFVEVSIGMLPAEFSAHLKEKLPRDAFETTRHWIVALKREVDTVLLPKVRARSPQAVTYYERAATFLTEERMLADLALEERFDTMIDKALKRFWQLKMGRELYPRRDPKLIEGAAPKQLEESKGTEEAERS